jgi:RecA/RadA recombinase
VAAPSQGLAGDDAPGAVALDAAGVLGGLTLLAGREGIGKSTVAVDIVVRVTRGVLDGEYYGASRNVIYVDSKDARDYTIAPRFVTAGADPDSHLP